MKNNKGIYKITNMVNGKVYIGQSKNLTNRKLNHFSALQGQYHQNIHLQYAANKYGLVNFKFDIIEITEVKDLTSRENYWMEFYKSYDRTKGYNIHKPSDNRSGYETTEETKDRISKSKIKYTDEELLKILEDFCIENGRVFKRDELQSISGCPNYSIYSHRFGSLRNALVLIGLEGKVDTTYLFDRKTITRDGILNSYKAFIEKNGRFPTGNERGCNKKNGLANSKYVIEYFGSTANLKKELGWNDVDVAEREKEESLIALKDLYEKEGKITYKLISNSKSTKSTGFYIKHFGSIDNALIASGAVTKDEIENKITPNKKTYSKEEVINNVKLFMEREGRFPVKKDFRNTTSNNIPSIDAINRLFGSVNNLKKELGLLNYNESKELERKEALDNLRDLYDKNGYLNFKLMDEKGIRSVNYYSYNFGTIEEIHDKLGITYNRSYNRIN